MLTRSGAEIVIHGDGHNAVVYKLHRPGTDPRHLAVRLRVAAGSQELWSPLSTVPEAVGDRWRTVWPYVETVVPQPENLPWTEAGGLLARLHAASLPARIPSHGWPRRRGLDPGKCLGPFGVGHGGITPLEGWGVVGVWLG
ncbi:hypothetical protein H7I58_30075, partial [Mycolicibacterium moriokaense]|nr:hypothetical protein [Mycolicibacterium moriokaense]